MTACGVKGYLAIQKDGSRNVNADGCLSRLMSYAVASSSEEKLFAPWLGIAKDILTGRCKALLQL